MDQRTTKDRAPAPKITKPSPPPMQVYTDGGWTSKAGKIQDKGGK